MYFFKVDEHAVRHFSREGRPTYEFGFFPGNVYVSSPWQLNKFKKSPDPESKTNQLIRINVRKIFPKARIPVDVGFSDLESVISRLPKSGAKIGIFNGMGRAIGDNLVGMTALRILRNQIQEHLPVNIRLFQFDPPEVEAICQRCDTVSSVRQLPIAIEDFLELDAYISLFGVYGSLNEHNFVDWYLKAFSVDYAAIAVSQKRNQFIIDHLVNHKIKFRLSKAVSSGRPLLLFHHKADANIRSMPQKLAVRWANEILNSTEYILVSAQKLPVEHPRFLDLSNDSDSLDHFASIIANCDAVITVDTLTYHLSDIFDVPTIALLMTIEPSLRVAYYPNVNGMLLCERDSPLYNQNTISGNPEKRHQQAADFNRNWERITVGEVVDALELKRKQTSN